MVFHCRFRFPLGNATNANCRNTISEERGLATLSLTLALFQGTLARPSWFVPAGSTPTSRRPTWSWCACRTPAASSSSRPTRRSRRTPGRRAFNSLVSYLKLRFNVKFHLYLYFNLMRYTFNMGFIWAMKVFVHLSPFCNIGLSDSATTFGRTGTK